jgi:hypothetical protein
LIRDELENNNKKGRNFVLGVEKLLELVMEKK